MDRRKNERTNKLRKPIVSFIITALHTKFEASNCYSSREIFDEKFNIGPHVYGEKEEWKIKWTNK